MLNPVELEKLVSELALRPRHEKVRALVYRLLVEDLGADSQDIDFEKPAPEVRGRIDALLGRTVFEFKSDLRRERGDAEKGLMRYLTEREGQTGEKFVGIATDGAEFIAYFLKDERVEEVSAHETDAESPRELCIWLQSVVATGEELPPDPLTITREFGRDSLAARRAFDALGALWEEIRANTRSAPEASSLGSSPRPRLRRRCGRRRLVPPAHLSGRRCQGDGMGSDDRDPAKERSRSSPRRGILRPGDRRPERTRLLRLDSGY